MIAERKKQIESPMQLDGWPASAVSSGLREKCFDHRRAGKRVHILFLIDELCEAGGAERVLLNTIRILPENRFRCSLATFKLDSSIDIFRQFPCPVHVFPLGRSYGWSGFQAALKLRKLIRSQEVEILHTFHETSDLWGSLVAKLSGCPVLISSRRDMGILRSAKHRIAYRVMSPLFDQVLTVSEEVRQFCINQDRLHPNKVMTLYNGIELQKVPAPSYMDGFRQKLGLAEASHLIVTVCNIRRVKGIDIFVQAAAIVRREFPRAVFLVVGDVSDLEYYRKLQAMSLEQGSAGNLRFIGPSEDVLNILKISDVFCLLSRSEGFSNALLEAMACGLPCVATRVGGNAEAIEDNVNGFLVAPEDSELAADRILRLLRRQDTARLMGQVARKTVEERFTAQAMMDKLIGVYDRLLGGTKAQKNRLQAEMDSAEPGFSRSKR